MEKEASVIGNEVKELKRQLKEAKQTEKQNLKEEKKERKKQQKLEQLRRITEGIAENNEQKIRMGLREYYLSYADAFVERWEKKAEETEK